MSLSKKEKEGKHMNVEKLCELKRTGTYRRLGKLFYTSRFAYLYDTGTGKVVRLDPEAQKCMECLYDERTSEQEFRKTLSEISNAESICEFIQKENLLCNPENTAFVDLSSQYTDDTFQCEQLTIELTGNCNLRCKYCIYNDYYEGNRAFNTSNIDFETARKAIDYVYAHSAEDKLAITFYGGEPLINFKVMKQCIDYSLQNIKNKQLYFSFTTNLTLMTKEIAEYVAQVPHMSILLSMDGPEEIHNAARVNRKGEGSFQAAFNGLILLAEAVNKYKNATLSFNAVLMPPYTEERFNAINNFFESLDFLPKDTEVRATYPAIGSVPDSYLEEIRSQGKAYKETTWISWAKEKANGKIVLNEKRNLFATVMQSGLVKIHNRVLHEKPMGYIHHNGCCIPGKRRLYVCTDGTYKVCERIGTAPSIGHVDTGIDTEAIKKYYLTEYARKSAPDCSQCWAVNLCDICYAQCYDEHGLNLEEKRKSCSQVKIRNILWLQNYHELLETNPEAIEEISKIEIT